MQPGIQFQDVTTILLDPLAFKHTIDLLTERYQDLKVDVIAGVLHMPTLNRAVACSQVYWWATWSLIGGRAGGHGPGLRLEAGGRICFQRTHLLWF